METFFTANNGDHDDTNNFFLLDLFMKQEAIKRFWVIVFFLFFRQEAIKTGTYALPCK